MGEAVPAEAAAGADTPCSVSGWLKAVWLRTEGRGGGWEWGWEIRTTRPDCNIVFAPCYGAVVLKVECASEPQKAVRTQMLGPSSEFLLQGIWVGPRNGHF